MKKLSILLASLCLMFSSVAINAQTVKEHAPYIKGYSDGTIRPDDNITREEAAVIIHRLVSDNVPTTMMLVRYSDLSVDRWSYHAVNILVNQNVITGYPDDTFRPSAKITRAEAAAMFSRLNRRQVPEDEGKADYKGHWAAGSIKYGIDNGYLKGYEDGNFKPDQYITRAEFIKMANKVFDRCVEIDAKIEKNQIPKDIKEDEWYFNDVIEAVLPHRYEIKDGKKVYTQTINAADLKNSNQGCQHGDY